MISLSIFANFRIDSEERLQRMKDSFMSFKSISAEQWVINIRGQYKLEAKSFLEEHLGSQLNIFQLESPEGWFHDSRIMTETIHSQYVFFWVEDHLNLEPDMSKYDEILSEMASANVDVMLYTIYWHVKLYSEISMNESENINWIDLTKSNYKLVLKKAPNKYILAIPSFFSGNLFKKIIYSDDEKQAIKWPKDTPFDFEKSQYDTHWLPFRMGLPKYELFASIDDDILEPGSCLISRGLYPARVTGPRMTTTSSVQPIRTPRPSLKQTLQRIVATIARRILS